MTNIAASLHASVQTVQTAAKTAANSVRSHKDHEYTWDELQRIEKRRRAILERSEAPFWSVLFHWDGTVLVVLVQDTLFWITIIIYILIRVWARRGIPDYVGDVSTGDTIAVIGGFTSFFLVFFVNQSNADYFELYSKSMACKERIFDTATIAVTALPKDVATRMIRYMNAAHVAGYTGLSKTYPASSFFAHLNTSLGLLTERELARMTDIDLDKGGSCQRELLVWCMSEIQTAQRKDMIDSDLATQLREKVLEMRSAFGVLFNAADEPIPFFYLHFICLLSSLYLPLFAISTGYRMGTGNETYWTADVVGGLVVVLQAVFVVGLRILGQKMSDPYGDDLEDLSVIFYCNFTWRMSNRILNAQFPSHDEDDQDEAKLSRNRREWLGTAFDRDSFQTRNTDVDENEDVDRDGIPINQLEDGTEPSSRVLLRRASSRSRRFSWRREGGSRHMLIQIP